jgi:dTDP-4-dehydrorhamnose 3,5-epimerase
VRAEPTLIPGCAYLRLEPLADTRGSFVKVYQRSVVEAMGLDGTVAEFYYSRSFPGVIRGLHFQCPPHDHAKTVVCIAGSIFDVVVDLRIGSPAFGEHATFALEGTAPTAVHVPTGCAHGFQATSDDTIVGYLVSTEHEPRHDTGIRWDSAGIEWPLARTVVSPRDQSFPRLAELDSPFRYRDDGG